MPISRYDTDDVLLNDNGKYKNLLDKRGVTKIYHYATPSIKNLAPIEYSQIKTIPHIWTIGDKYFKLAHKYYQDPTLWWVIGWFNQKPTDAHVFEGDPIYIPIPIEDALYYYNTR